MKKSGWVIIPLFIIFLINALVKKKEFLAPESLAACSNCSVSTEEDWNEKVIAAGIGSEGIFF